jgi:hypothetical protein
MPKVKIDQVRAAIDAVVRDRLEAAAGGNGLISRAEQQRLDPFLRQAAEAARAEAGKGARLGVDAVHRRALGDVDRAWAAENQPSGAGAALLSRREVGRIARKDASLGALTRLAVMRATQGQGGAALGEAVRGFFAAFDFRADPGTCVRPLHAGLPGAERIDARPIFPQNRAGVPAGVLAAYDFYGRAMDADWATVSLQRARIDGHEVYLVYTSTDGDDAYLEVLDRRGQPVTSARIFAEELVGFDETFGRARFSPSMVGLDAPATQEGLSEPADRAAAGQPPLDWTGDVRLDQGRLEVTPLLRLGSIDAPALQGSGREALGAAALEYLFERSLKYRLAGQPAPLQLGPQRDGTLVLGRFDRPTDGKTFEVAMWRDIDDGSFTLYFDRAPDGRLRLAIEQFDN